MQQGRGKFISNSVKYAPPQVSTPARETLIRCAYFQSIISNFHCQIVSDTQQGILACTRRSREASSKCRGDKNVIFCCLIFFILKFFGYSFKRFLLNRFCFCFLFILHFILIKYNQEHFWHTTDLVKICSVFVQNIYDSTL